MRVTFQGIPVAGHPKVCQAILKEVFRQAGSWDDFRIAARCAAGKKLDEESDAEGHLKSAGAKKGESLREDDRSRQSRSQEEEPLPRTLEKRLVLSSGA
jgi:hypothetical protein